MFNLKNFILSSSLLFSVFSSPVFSNPKVLKVGAIPDQNQDVLDRRFNLFSKELSKQLGMILIFAIITFGALLPLLRRVIVPASFSSGAPVISDGDFEEELDKVEVQEGDTLEDIKAKLKPKKQAISAEMLDTANTYDDKVAVIRMIVGDQAGRVSNVFKNMMKEQQIDN